MIRLVARPFDSPDAQRLIRALYAEQLDTYGFADSPDREASGDYDPPRGLLLVAYSPAGEPIGCGGYRTYNQAEQVAEVRKMYVRPAERGQGVGRQLLSQLEQEAAEHGACRMLLETGSLNSSAIGLYAASGYEAIQSYVTGRRLTNRAFAKQLCQG
ncbi:GNAT family N-acetyltransferase [Kribbella sp. NPDC059898]|uniref:GNAT family N-acetyltransferase n=1 Tax=Kribbella sp. NPDC059898 TaxID=3346995 RepID=UPI003662EA5B